MPNTDSDLPSAHELTGQQATDASDNLSSALDNNILGLAPTSCSSSSSHEEQTALPQDSAFAEVTDDNSSSQSAKRTHVNISDSSAGNPLQSQAGSAAKKPRTNKTFFVSADKDPHSFQTQRQLFSPGSSHTWAVSASGESSSSCTSSSSQVADLQDDVIVGVSHRNPAVPHMIQTIEALMQEAEQLHAKDNDESAKAILKSAQTLCAALMSLHDDVHEVLSVRILVSTCRLYSDLEVLALAAADLAQIDLMQPMSSSQRQVLSIEMLMYQGLLSYFEKNYDETISLLRQAKVQANLITYDFKLVSQISLHLAYAMLYDVNSFDEAKQEIEAAKQLLQPIDAIQGKPWMDYADMLSNIIEYLEWWGQQTDLVVNDDMELLREVSDKRSALTEALINPNCRITDLVFTLIDEDDELALLAILRHPKVQLNRLRVNNTESPMVIEALALALQNGRIRKLNLADGEWNYKAMPTFAIALRDQNCNLSHLNLSNNYLGDLGALSLVSGLGGSSLIHLDLEDNDIRAMGAGALAAGLMTSQNQLQTVDISRNFFGSAGAMVLAGALADSNCQLQHLDLSFYPPSEIDERWGGITEFHDRIHDHAVIVLAQALTVAHTKLIELRLNYHRIGQEGIRALSNALTHVDGKLETLCLMGNDLDAACASLLAEAIQQPNWRLRELWLGNNLIGVEGTRMLADALTKASSAFIHLGLSDNDIGDEGAQALAKALQHPGCPLKCLVIRDNHISHVGIQALASALSHVHCKLESLDLEGNIISDESIEALATALSKPGCKLKCLSLANTQMTASGIERLVNAWAQHGCQLETLILEGNRFGDAGIEILAAVLRHPGCKLKTLNLIGTDITAAGVKMLGEALASNKSMIEVMLPHDVGYAKHAWIDPYCARNRHNLEQRHTTLAQQLGHWASFFDPETDAAPESVSEIVEHHLSDDADVTAEIQADNVTGTSACSLDP